MIKLVDPLTRTVRQDLPPELARYRLDPQRVRLEAFDDAD